MVQALTFACLVGAPSFELNETLIARAPPQLGCLSLKTYPFYLPGRATRCQGLPSNEDCSLAQSLHAHTCKTSKMLFRLPGTA